MSNPVQCPICSKFFGLDRIESHVDQCLNSDTSNEGTKDTTTPILTGQIALNTTPTRKRPSMVGLDKDRAKDTKHLKLTPNSKQSHFLGSDSSGSSSKLITSSQKSYDITKPSVPLADVMRPKLIEDYVGQEKVIGKESILRKTFETGNIPSLIFWGPPGCGKTTLARIIAQLAKEKHKMRFVQLSATTSGVADVKEAVKVAKNEKIMFKRGTLLFIDEIHRFNKLQQDSFLPHVEDGTIVLLGATTENPSFQVNSALLSRCRVIVLTKLSVSDIESILRRALLQIEVVEYTGDKSLLHPSSLAINTEALSFLAQFSDGDARIALNGLQLAAQAKKAESSFNSGPAQTEGECESSEHCTSDSQHVTSNYIIEIDDIKESLQRSHLLYNKDERYNCISALIKSMRGSDENAALYWLARMLVAGEDPLYIARRVIVFASEDVGLADPNALCLAVATFHACHAIGMPECEYNLSQAVVYMAKATKSRVACNAYMSAKSCVEKYKGPHPPVPLHLRNAPTHLMKKLGYGNKVDSSDETDYFLPKELKGYDFFKQSDHFM